MQTYNYRDIDTRQITAGQLIVGHRVRIYTAAGFIYPTVINVERDEPTKWFPTGEIVVTDSDSPNTVRIFHPDDVVYVAAN